MREAIRRLKDSTLGRGASLGTLPLVFLLGDSGSTKTTIIIHSALDPELLAGQVYQDNNMLPTRVANIWYTRQAIFVDPAGNLHGTARPLEASGQAGAAGSRFQCHGKRPAGTARSHRLL